MEGTRGGSGTRAGDWLENKVGMVKTHEEWCQERPNYRRRFFQAAIPGTGARGGRGAFGCACHEECHGGWILSVMCCARTRERESEGWVIGGPENRGRLCGVQGAGQEGGGWQGPSAATARGQQGRRGQRRQRPRR